MRLRLGQSVQATDGEFGEVGDIIVDPVRRTVTHLVVQPHRRHYQARLVPIALVSVEDDTAMVNLDGEGMRHLQRVSDSEFTRLGEPIDVGPEWDIGTEDVVSMPSMDAEYGMWSYDDRVTVNYDRIPRGECEIRRSSAVLSADDHEVGTVEGFLADDEHLAGVVVRTGRPGLRHFVVVPIDSVARVRNDLITLTVDEAAFGALPFTDDVLGQHHSPSRLTGLEHRAARALRSIAARLGRGERSS